MQSSPCSLTKDHALGHFDCGKDILSSWLKLHALQSQNSGHTKTMVVCDDNKVIAYYSYNVISVEHTADVPGRVKKGLAKHPIPIFLIARLAVDLKFQGQKLGSKLLCHALAGAASITDTVPIRAIVVDALDAQAKAFYSSFDFVAFPEDKMRMWLLMKDLVKTLNSDIKK